MILIDRLLARRSKATNESSQLVGEQLVLEELRNTLAVQLHNADQLDDKLKELLGSASLVLSIAVSLQASIGGKQVGVLYVAGLILVLVAYVSLLVVVLLALSPKIYHMPVPNQWDELAERYFDEKEQIALRTMISTYLDVQQKNQAPIRRKKRAVLWSSVLLVLIVLILLFMTLTALDFSTGGSWRNSPLVTPSP